jgi:hypothetical protein
MRQTKATCGTAETLQMPKPETLCQSPKKHKVHSTHTKKYDESKDGVRRSPEHESGSVVAI